MSKAVDVYLSEILNMWGFFICLFVFSMEQLGYLGSEVNAAVILFLRKFHF